MTRLYEGIRGNDTLIAEIQATRPGETILAIMVERSGMTAVLVHLTVHPSQKDAEREMREAFPDVEWR